MSAAIEGISHWLGLWRDYVVEVPNWASIWCRAWDLAIEETNSMEVPEEGADLEDLALNTCVGKLVGVFLTGCPDLSRGPRPFDCDGDLRRIRSELVKACGLSGLIAKHRTIWHLDYFLRADEEWTRNHLIGPLCGDDERAVASGVRSARCGQSGKHWRL